MELFEQQNTVECTCVIFVILVDGAFPSIDLMEIKIGCVRVHCSFTCYL